MKHRGLIEALCPTCGTVVARTSDLRCGSSEAEESALCEFPCPSCHRLLHRPVPPVELGTLLLLGAHETSSLPFELLEAHSGTAVSWDEVLDAHLALETQPFPQLEIEGSAA